MALQPVTDDDDMLLLLVVLVPALFVWVLLVAWIPAALVPVLLVTGLVASLLPVGFLAAENRRARADSQSTDKSLATRAASSTVELDRPPSGWSVADLPIAP